jgi:hypothetical protein
LVDGTGHRSRWRMPKSRQFLLEQIARARRFAAAMNTDSDRARFEKIAADYESELAGATEAAQAHASHIPAAPVDAVRSNGTTEAQAGTTDLNAAETDAKAKGDHESRD